MSLDPEQLTPEASINRVRIVDLPGVKLPADVKGKTAFEFCSQAAFAASIRSQAAALDLAPDADDAELPPMLAARLEDARDPVRQTARAIAEDFGRRLGVVIATLKRGDEPNQRARPEWDGSYWRHWRSIRRVWLGGGLVSGALGGPICEQVLLILRQAGVHDCDVRAYARPDILPLVGAAREVMTSAGAALVADFGQTNIKAGVAMYEDGRLRRLEVLNSQPSVARDADVAESMARLLAELYSAEATRLALGPEIGVCIASYVKDNHLYGYTRTPFWALHSDVTNLGCWLSQRISALVGRELRVRLLHDGSAAAATFAGERHTAVVMVGTALGSGFPTLKRRVVDLDLEFEVRSLQKQ
jgi:hypothetical protein